MLALLLAALVAAAAAQSSCLEDPSQASCAQFSISNDQATMQTNMLCQMMPNMAVCTLRTICEENADNTAIGQSHFCAPFSLLKAGCTDMPNMGACQMFNAMCGPGSVVQQCQMHSASSSLPTSLTMLQDVQGICASHQMDQCAPCQAQGMLPCPVLASYSDLCQQMGHMPQCSSYGAMCEGALSEWPFCPRSLLAGPQPGVMRMFFHTSSNVYVLFESFVPQTSAAYVGAFFFAFFLAFFFEGLKSFLNFQYQKWTAEYAAELRNPMLVAPLDPNAAPADVELQWKQSHRIGDRMKRISKNWFALLVQFPWNARRELARSALRFFDVMFGLAIMLIAMTFNVGLFFALCGGALFGALAFGRITYQNPDGSLGMHVSTSSACH